MKTEAKVGIFVFLGVLFLFFLTTQVGSFQHLSRKGYPLYTYLDDAGGLEKNAKVKANGIDVGYVDEMSIDHDRIKVKLFIYENVKIPVDSKLIPKQESMLGGKYVGIILGKNEKTLRPGETIEGARPLAGINEASDSIAQAATEFTGFVKEFRQMMNLEARTNLQNTFANLEEITSQLKAFVKLQKLNEVTDHFDQMAQNLSQTGEKFGKTADVINKRLPQIMTNIDQLVRDLKVMSEKMRTDFPRLADKFNAIGDDLDTMIKENKKPLNATLNYASDFFATGSDSFKKFDNLLGAIDKVKLEVAMHNEWMSSDGYNKGYLDLNYMPSDSKQYKFSIAGMDDYSRLDENGRLIPPKKHEKSQILFSAQIAKRFDDIGLRAGIIENTAGLGLDYYLLSDALQLKAEVYDFNAEYDVRGKHPHAKMGARYSFLKHLDVFAGYDNFLNSEADNAYVGMGIHFFDDDLKTLIMSQGVGSLAK